MKQFLKSNKKTKANSLPKLLFLTDDEIIKNKQEVEQIVQGLNKNIGVVVREYNNPNKAKLFSDVSKIAKQKNITLFVANNGNENNIKNQHWPQTGRLGQRKKHRSQLITTSAHNLSELGRANRLNVSAVLISPVYSTKSHTNKKPLNIHRFARLAKLARSPVYALGGVATKQAAQILRHKISHGVAGIGLFRSKAKR